MDKKPKEPQYTFFRIDFKDWGEEFDYTIVEKVEDVLLYLQLAEIHLDDDTRRTRVIVRGVPMTRRKFEQWQEKHQP